MRTKTMVCSIIFRLTLPAFIWNCLAGQGRAETVSSYTRTLEQKVADLEVAVSDLKDKKENGDAAEATIRNLKTQRKKEEIAKEITAENIIIENVTSDFSLKLGGRVKFDVFYDTGSKGGVYGLDPATIPLKRLDPRAAKIGNFNMGLLGTRLSAEVKKVFDQTSTRAYVEVDFAKGDSLTSTTTNSIVPRIRHAYVEVGGLLIGQTWFTFQDMNAFADTLDNLYGGSRQPMIRYTFKFKNGSFAIALERPNSKYINDRGDLKDNDNDGRSTLPDLAFQLRHDCSKGHLSFRGVARKLQVKAFPDGYRRPIENDVFGWGLGISGKAKFVQENAIFFQINGGRGIGQYVDGIESQDFYYQETTFAHHKHHAFKILKVMDYILGVELHFTEKLKSTVAGSYSRIYVPHHIPQINQFNRSQERYHTNLIYSIFPNCSVGLEVMYYRRKAGTHHRHHHSGHFKGEDTRILSSFNYKF